MMYDAWVYVRAMMRLPRPQIQLTHLSVYDRMCNNSMTDLERNI